MNEEQNLIIISNQEDKYHELRLRADSFAGVTEYFISKDSRISAAVGNTITEQITGQTCSISAGYGTWETHNVINTSDVTYTRLRNASTFLFCSSVMSDQRLAGSTKSVLIMKEKARNFMKKNARARGIFNFQHEARSIKSK